MHNHLSRPNSEKSTLALLLPRCRHYLLSLRVLLLGKMIEDIAQLMRPARSVFRPLGNMANKPGQWYLAVNLSERALHMPPKKTALKSGKTLAKNGSASRSPRSGEDVTERKQAYQQELRILGEFVKRAPMGVLMLDRHMRGIQVSQRWLDDVGMTRDQVIGRSVYANFPNMPAHWRDLHRRGLAGESLSGHEEMYFTPDGKEHCINWEIAPWGHAGERAGGILISMDDVTERKRSEKEAQQSAATMLSLIASAPQSVIAVSPDEKIVLANGNVEKMFGYLPGELIGQRLDTLVPESLRVRHAEHHRAYFANMRTRPMGIGLNLEARRKDGAHFPVEVGLSAIEAAAGKLAVAFITDITERRRLEQTAQTRAQEVEALWARLLKAQEEERRRVSRELHDQICQQLASLAIDVGGLAAGPLRPEHAQRQLMEIQERVVKASEETRHIAYTLHPAMLDDLGLVASLKELCNRFSEQNPDTLLEFRSNTPRVEIPREVASCLYRVAQEGLQNLARHSDAEHASVALSIEKEGIVMLTIADDGAGFDLELVHGRGGLGMIGMEERAQLVHGKLTIATQPGHGTRIILKVPMLGGSL